MIFNSVLASARRLFLEKLLDQIAARGFAFRGSAEAAKTGTAK
jgi:hypothetical protein